MRNPLHPALQKFLSSDEVRNRVPWQNLGVTAARAGFRMVGLANGRGPQLAEVADVDLGGIACREYTPEANRPGLVVYFHGGGFVLGDLETHDATCRRVAAASGRRVVAVDYALAPEHPYPKPLDDCERATRMAVAQYATPMSRTVVMGDSAGGCLALATANRIAVSGDRLAGQCLLYAGIDSRRQTESYREFATGYGLSAETMAWFWDQYLDDIEAANAPPDASPSLLEAVVHLPPSYVLTCEYDVLRDEGEAFAKRLLAAGVPTRAVRWPGVIHGFVQLAGIVSSGQEATEEAALVAGAMIDGRFGELAMDAIQADASPKLDDGDPSLN